MAAQCVLARRQYESFRLLSTSTAQWATRATRKTPNGMRAASTATGKEGQTRAGCQSLGSDGALEALRYEATPRIGGGTRGYASEANQRNVTDEELADDTVVRNHVGVQLLPRALHKQLFQNVPFPPPSDKAVSISLSHLKKHDLAQSVSPIIAAPTFRLPPLQGSTIDEHFWRLGVDRAEPYLSLCRSFAKADLPPMPSNWAARSGWTMYHHDGSFEAVAAPPDEALAFDVETLPATTQFAVMAIAASTKHWYSWVSPWLLGEAEDPDQLVPLPGEAPRLVVGHNVGFDRARIGQEYDIRGTRTRFLDTMSLHIACYGLSNPQRPAYLSIQKLRKARNAAKAAAASGEEDVDTATSEMSDASLSLQASLPELAWTDVSSMNSLDEVARLHCGIEVDKTIRNAFLEWDQADIVANLPRLLDYCATDVLSTHAVFAKLLPEFLEQCPNPVSFAGMLHMGNPFLPVDETWERFLQRADDTYRSKLKGVKDNLLKLAEATRKLMFVEDEKTGRMVWEDDHWLKQLDWTPKKARWTASNAPDELKNIALSGSPDAPAQTPAEAPSNPAFDSKNTAPAWFVDLRDPVDGALQISHTAHLAALLFRVSFAGCPVVWSRQHGWLCCVSADKAAAIQFDEDDVEVPRSELPARFSVRPGERFFALPTRGARKTKLRTLLAKKNGKMFENGDLTSPFEEAGLACQISRDPDSADETVAAVYRKLGELANASREMSPEEAMECPWMRQLDWSMAEDDGPKISNPQDMRAVSLSSFERALDLKSMRRRLQQPGQAGSSRSASTVAATSIPADTPPPVTKGRGSTKNGLDLSNEELVWPHWYWHLTRGGIEKISLTTKSQLTPLLLRLSFLGHPLYKSRQHGWVFRIPLSQLSEPWYSRAPLTFTTGKDPLLENDTEAVFFKIPHPGGEEENVGSPLAKSFDKAFESGTLKASPLVFDGQRYDTVKHEQQVDSDALGENAKAALSMNLQCSYWLNASQRIKEQMVIWKKEEDVADPGAESPLDRGEPSTRKQGVILPQVTVMGTVTRRATEKTWLAAANAKKNKIGTELKSMIRAPPGYAIVGADVDSEELWISSVMGDAQFGIHGATAIGWMTLEGSKAAGTDLHSKTASILGISRNDAKVFNYSRIYGAGVTHAVQLLLKADATLPKASATKLARQLYISTKGNKHYKGECFHRKFWYGGTESYLFNKLEEIALADDPKTPALGCGVTRALQKRYLPEAGAGQDFMTSRVNWAVQSSGVDYLHMLIVAMDYLAERFGIQARYMISVHDEIRYLAKWEDRFRCALALQIANLWTRAQFAFMLEMDDLPQSCAWFSAVDLDHVLRKEVDVPCTTPSNPDPIPPGQSLDIGALLEHVSETLLGPPRHDLAVFPPSGDLAYAPPPLQHRSSHSEWLEAQSLGDAKAVRRCWDEALDAEFRQEHGNKDHRFNDETWKRILEAERAEPPMNKPRMSQARRAVARPKPTSARSAGKSWPRPTAPDQASAWAALDAVGK